MKSTIILILIFILSGTTNVSAQQNDPLAILNVIVKNLRSNDGQVKIALFNSEDGFPDKSEKAFKRTVHKIDQQQVEVNFEDVPFGTYAVGILHDENVNGEMDSNWLGIPNEGYGASNDAKGSFGPPSYDDARFEIKSDTMVVIINTNY